MFIKNLQLEMVQAMPKKYDLKNSHLVRSWLDNPVPEILNHYRLNMHYLIQFCPAMKIQRLTSVFTAPKQHFLLKKEQYFYSFADALYMDGRLNTFPYGDRDHSSVNGVFCSVYTK